MEIKEITCNGHNSHRPAPEVENGRAICPTCSQVIPASAPMGLCPCCLLGIGIEAQRGAFDDTLDDTTDPPDTARLERRDQSGAASGNTLFGPFELGELLGSGGMGEVYRARDLRVGRDVALKKLPGGEHASKAALRLFHEEIKAFAHLDHPSVVPIYEAGDHRGQHYFTMKLVPSDLQQQLWRFEGDPRGAAELAEKIARAVHHLHQHGILHRDLKPANILLDHASPPNPYVADFGIARQIGDDGRLKLKGEVAGTAPYMAPEQEAGESVTWAADVYSLGVILYELLTRERFPRKGVEDIRQARRWPPKDPREVDPRVDRDLSRICLRCLARDPGQRYSSAEALAQALRRHLNGEAPEGAGRIERAWRWSLRHSVTAGLILAVLSFLVPATSRFVSLVGQQEAAKQAQIRQVNMNSAAMVAGTVLSQLRTLSDAVERTASAPELARALEEGDDAALQALCQAAFEYYEDPAHGLKHNASSPFDTWFVGDNDGIARGQFTKGDWGRTIGKDYAWRDYFIGARQLAKGGRRSTYVARTLRSEVDDLYKFAISAPIYGKGGQPVGVLVATIASRANLGSLVLDDTESIAVLVAPRGRERNDSIPESPYLLLRHPAFAYGEAIGMNNEQVRRVGEIDLDSETRIERQLWLPDPGRVTSISGYQDPVAATHPEYAGSWLAGFAPVGNTGYAVIVQSREEETMKPERTLARLLAKWTAVSAVPGVLLVLFAAVHSRWRKRRRPA